MVMPHRTGNRIPLLAEEGNSFVSYILPAGGYVIQKGVKIEPTSGKLGVLIQGLGAVSTTFIVGVEAIKTKNAKPIGSLTQLGIIRHDWWTDRRLPKVQDSVPIA